MVESWDFDAAVLGAGLPMEVQELVTEAGCCRGADPARAERLLDAAKVMQPKHPAVLIALYRHHFYAHRLTMARDVALQALDVAREQLSSDGAVGGVVGPVDDARVQDDVTLRFYLFCLKGLAYLSLRLGDLDMGRSVLTTLRQLDPKDRLGAAVLSHVLTRAQIAQEGDEDSELCLDQPLTRGWEGV